MNLLAYVDVESTTQKKLFGAWLNEKYYREKDVFSGVFRSRAVLSLGNNPQFFSALHCAME